MERILVFSYVSTLSPLLDYYYPEPFLWSTVIKKQMLPNDGSNYNLIEFSTCINKVIACIR